MPLRQEILTIEIRGLRIMKTIPCHKCNNSGKTSNACTCDEGSNSLLIDLLACPFCGGTAKATGFGPMDTVVTCLHCSAETTTINDWNARPVCEWKYDDFGDSFYSTSCENEFVIIDGTPEDNDMKFCPYCAGRIEAR
jgi:uncharacterized protein YbaR (Trm112 family)